MPGDRIRTPLIQPDGSIDIPTARARCLSLTRAMIEALAIAGLALQLDPEELRRRLLEWRDKTRARFDI